MSHTATNWAIKQRGLKPASKLVLWHLCDRYHPDHGCFPSQETLAYDTEMSRSTLNEHLGLLEAARLIRREVRRNPGSKRQETTRYRFAFEPDFDIEPCPDSGHGSVSGNDPEPCPENGPSRVRNPDSNLVREPVKEPEREGAREAGKGKAAEQLLALKRMHPASSQEDPLVVAALWDELTSAERNAAVDRHADWLEDGRRAKRTVVPKLAFYLGKKLWNELPPRQAGAAAKPAGDRAWLGGFDRPWWCFVFGMIARDRASLADRGGAPARALQRVFSLATSRLGTPIPSEELPDLEEAALRMVKLHIQSAEWSAWRGAVYQAFRFHLPAPSATDWVWVPARTPAEWLDPAGATILPPIEPTKGAA